jgi:PKD repeat protein
MPPKPSPETPSFDAEVSASTADANSSITFTDNSTGVTSRKWTFPLGNPATSDAAEVNVTFPHSGPVIATLEITFNDGTTETKDFPLQIGNELYSRQIFGFEDPSKLADIGTTSGATWKTWDSSGGTDNIQVELDNTQGANGTSNSVKVSINTANVEYQLFTKENGADLFNARLESNKTYTFSFYIKGTLSSINASEVTNQHVVDGETIQAWKNFAWISPTYVSEDWVKISQEFETGDLSEVYSEGAALNAYPQFKFVSEETGVIYIDEVSIQEGAFGNNNPEPINFDPSVSSTLAEAGQSITFTDNSSGVESRSWSFPGGDPATSTEQSVDVSYAAGGTYTASVEVTFVDGSTQTKDFEITIQQQVSGTELFDQGFWGFEDNTALASWTLWNSSGNEDISKSIANEGYQSDKSIQLTFNNSSGSEVQLLSRDVAGVNATLSAGKTYVFSFWSKSDDGVDVSNAQVFVGDNSPWTQYFWTDEGVSATSEWVKFSTTFQAQDPFVEANADNVFVQFKFFPAGTGNLLIDEISLREIN